MTAALVVVLAVYGALTPPEMRKAVGGAGRPIRRSPSRRS